jgi:probable HAF family extracellular repeat protein
MSSLGRVFLIAFLLGLLILAGAMTPLVPRIAVAGHVYALLAKKKCTTKKVHGKKKKVCTTVKTAPKPTATPTPAPKYTLVDVGTLGGPNAWFSIPGQVIANDGTVLVSADTKVDDPDYQNIDPVINPPDPVIQHAALWRKGILTDLGALPGNNASVIFEMNASGEGAGASENGATNPLVGYPQIDGVVWKDGQIINLGTLGGTDSMPFWINDQGQVVGLATNTIPDQLKLLDVIPSLGTQTHAFLWQDGHMSDLGTLGGPDSGAMYINNRSQVAGVSFTNATVNATTGIPIEHPFLWQNGHMQDLGTLGGTKAYPSFSGSQALNERGEVVGLSTLKGDPAGSVGLATHPFLWDGTSMKDLGTFGGDFGEAHALNQAGDVVGFAATSDANAHAFLWKNGMLTDLDGASSTDCHYADSINASDQVVGGSCGTGVDGWLWDHGTLSDLNTLIARPASRLVVQEAHYISDQGEIAAVGVLPNGDHHMVLLVPIAMAQSKG